MIQKNVTSVSAAFDMLLEGIETEVQQNKDSGVFRAGANLDGRDQKELLAHDRNPTDNGASSGAISGQLGETTGTGFAFSIGHCSGPVQ